MKRRHREGKGMLKRRRGGIGGLGVRHGDDVTV